MKPTLRYFLHYEMGIFAMSIIAGISFYFAYGLLPAIRIFAGSLIAVHLGLAWVFRETIAALLKSAIGRLR